MITVAQVMLLLLHGPDGHEILLNPKQVVSLHSAIPGKPNVSVVNAVRCLINTTDGKFVSVVEHCDAISGMLKENKR